MKKNNLVYTTFLFVVVLLFGACGTSTNKEDVIKFGVITHLTGEAASVGNSMINGIELAVDDYNSKNLLNNKKIVAIYEDDRLKAKDALNAFKKLTELDNVPIIIGSGASSITIELAPQANSKKVVLISSISTADTLKYAGDYFFRVVPPNNRQGLTAANFVINTLKKETSAIFYANDDYGISLAKSYEDAINNLGKKILIKESYNAGEKDFKLRLIKIKKENPDVIFIPGIMPEVGLIVKQIRELNIKSKIIGGDGAYSPELFNTAGKASDSTFYTIMSLPPDTSVVFTKFKENYLKKFQKEPDIWAVLAYDAAWVAFDAIKSCNLINGEEIKNNLYKTTYQGVSGLINFDSFGEVDKNFSIYILIDGKFQLYKY